MGADDREQPAVQQLYDVVTDSLAEDYYTNNPPELAVLEGAYFGYPIDEYATPALARALSDAAKAGLVVADPRPTSCGWQITQAGEKRLADLWGEHRVPPGKGGHVSCFDHGTYVAAPGDLWACPECPATDDEVLSQVEADNDPLIASVLVELRANDIRRLQDGDLTDDETAVLAAMADHAVVSRAGRWVTSVNYAAELLRDAGLAEVEEDPDGCRYLIPTADGQVWLLDATAGRDADRRIREFEASRRRRKAIRLVVVVAVLLTVLTVFAATAS